MEPQGRIRRRTVMLQREAIATRLVQLIVVVILLATAPAAGAKELTAQVCGAGGCVTVSDRGQSGALHSTGVRAGPPDPAPFYVVRFRETEPGRPIAWSYLYVASARAMRGNEFGSGPVRWMRAPSLIVSILGELTNGLEPYPASSTWKPTVSARAKPFPLVWAILGALASVAVIAIGLQRLRSRRRGLHRGLHATRVPGRPVTNEPRKQAKSA
jgi:hypothetical protein